MRISLGHSNELAACIAKGYSFEHDGNVIELFVVKQDQHFYAYLNQCPHTGVNLNWQPDQFLSLDEQHIQCSLHGALFRISDGYCEWGPCLGKSLQTLPIQLKNGELIIDWTATTAPG